MKKFKLATTLAMTFIILVGCIQDKRQIDGGANDDSTSPVIMSNTPANFATEVFINNSIVIVFNEDIASASVDGGSLYLKNTTTTVPSNVSVNGKVCTIIPNANLAEGTTYTAYATTGITDLAGNSVTENFQWSFTTGSGASATDSTAPTLTSSTPANNATGVALNASISLVFSEAVLPSSVTSSTVTVKAGSVSLTGALSVNGNMVSFTPSSAFTKGTLYTVAFGSGIKDLAGNGLASSSFSFTSTNSGGTVTDNIAPQVSSTTPLNNAVSISRTGNITVIFNEQMDTSTVNTTTFSLTAGSAIAGTVSCDGLTAVFRPASALSPLSFSRGAGGIPRCPNRR